MTMIPTIVRANCYNIRIAKGEGEMFSFEYEELYDKDDDEHIKAFENMEQIKSFNEQMLSTYGKATLEFSKDDMAVKLILTAPFDKIANFISMEFLMCGTVGKMTLLDLVSMASAPMVSGILERGMTNENVIKTGNSESNKDMYV